MKKLVLTGPYSPAMRAAVLRRLPTDFTVDYVESREDYKKLHDADYTIIRTLNFNAEDIASMENMKLIQRWGVGYDTVDIQAAAEHGIPVAISYGINSTPVAEMTLALTLAVYRHLPVNTRNVMDGNWDRSYDKISYTIHGKTVGVVGLGNIGRKAAALYQAFGAQILYFDAFRLRPEDETARNVTYCPLDELWGKCDIISLHTPLTEETVHMVNQEVLAKMKDGAVLINTARAELIDLDALAEALRSGKLLGAGLDAIDEDIASHNPFLGMDNVVLSPHLGGNTADNVDATAERSVSQILAVDRGEKLKAPACVNAHLLNL